MAYEPTLEDFEEIEISIPTQDMGSAQAQSGASMPEKPESLLGSLASGAGRFGGGVLQGAANVGQGLGDLETRLVNALLGTKLQAPKPDVFGALGVDPGLAGKIGELGGEIAGAGALGGGLFSATKGLQAPKAVSKLGRPAEILFEQLTGAPGAFGVTTAATMPGTMSQRAKAGALAYGTGKALEGAGKLYNYVQKNVSPKKMGQLLDKYNETATAESKDLYNRAFEGTSNAKPVVSGNTIANITEVFEKPGGGKIKDSIEVFKRRPSLENLHGIRKDVQGKIRDLNKVSEKSGLGGSDSDLLNTLKKLEGSLDKDLRTSFQRLDPQKFNQWRDAQSHYREKIVPLKKYKSVRDYLGSERKLSKSLKRDLLTNENTAKFLADELGISQKGAQILGGTKLSPLTKNLGAFELFKSLLGS